ncbi:hypothetical protein OAQ24_00710 [Flavobacteriaceae bacterium]|nr:hypothetical protein [Flavobacteriaceae bacterium]
MPSDQSLFIVFQIISPIILGVIGQQIAKKKNLNPKDGFLAGVFGNLIGIIILLSLKERPIPFTSDKVIRIQYHIKNKAIRILLKLGMLLLLIMVSMFFGLVEMKSRGGISIRPAFTLSWMFYSYILIFSRFSKYTIWGKEIFPDNLQPAYEVKPKQAEPIYKEVSQEKEDNSMKKSNDDSNLEKLKAFKLEDGRTLFVDENGKVVSITEVQEYILEDGSKIYIRDGKVICKEVSQNPKDKTFEENNIPPEKLLSREDYIDLKVDYQDQEQQENSQKDEIQEPFIDNNQLNNARKQPDPNTRVFILAMTGFVVIIAALYFYSESQKSQSLAIISRKSNTTQDTSKRDTSQSTSKKKIVDDLKDSGIYSANESRWIPERSPTRTNNNNQRRRSNNQLRVSVEEILNLGKQYLEMEMHQTAITQYSQGINNLLDYGLNNLDNDNIKLLSELYFQRGMAKDRAVKNNPFSTSFKESATSDRKNAVDILDRLKY